MAQGYARSGTTGQRRKKIMTSSAPNEDIFRHPLGKIRSLKLKNTGPGRSAKVADKI